MSSDDKLSLCVGFCPLCHVFERVGLNFEKVKQGGVDGFLKELSAIHKVFAYILDSRRKKTDQATVHAHPEELTACCAKLNIRINFPN
jgi:hypothetical protein